MFELQLVLVRADHDVSPGKTNKKGNDSLYKSAYIVKCKIKVSSGFYLDMTDLK